MDFLRDPIWQFVGALLALIAVLFSVYAYSRQRKRKALSYDLLTYTKVVTIGEKLRGKVQVLYDGIPVENAYLGIVRVYNSGNVPITPSDLIEPLVLSFGEQTETLGVEILDTEPRDLNPAFDVDAGRIEFAPLLLNPEDSLIVKALVKGTGSQPSISVQSRIVGIHNITKRPLYMRLYWRSVLLAFLVSAGGIGLEVIGGQLAGIFSLAPLAMILVQALIMIVIILGMMIAFTPVSQERARIRIYEERYLANHSSE